MADEIVLVVPRFAVSQLIGDPELDARVKALDGASSFAMIGEIADIVTIVVGTISIAETALRLAAKLREALRGRDAATVLVRGTQDDFPIVFSSDVSDHQIVAELLRYVRRRT